MGLTQLSVHRNSHAELHVDPVMLHVNAGCQALQRRRDVHWIVGGAAGTIVKAHAYVRCTHPFRFGRAGQPQDVRAALSRRGSQELNMTLSHTIHTSHMLFPHLAAAWPLLTVERTKNLVMQLYPVLRAVF